MANAWIAHIKATRKQYPNLMQNGGLKAVILKAKETYKNQSGGSGCPMGGAMDSIVDNAENVAGMPARAIGGDGVGVAAKLTDAHMMDGGKRKKGKKGNKSKKSVSGKSKKGGSRKSKKSKKAGSRKSNKSKKSRK